MTSIHDVCILGAGFAGLAAARKLQESCKNLRVCVLEARDRIGGRIHTMSIANESFDASSSQWVGPGQQRILQLISHFGLELVEQEYSSTCASSTSRLNNMASYEFPLFCEDEQRQVDAFFAHVDALGAQMDCKAPWDMKDASYYDNYSLYTYAEVKIPSDNARREVLLFAQTVLACDPKQCSFLFFVFYVASGGGFESLGDGDQGAQKWKLKRGAQSVAECILKELQASEHFSMVYNSPISTIEHSNSSEFPITLHSFHNATYLCKRVIVAMCPALALKQVTFVPELPTQKRELVNAMAPGTCIKVIIAYREAFWKHRVAGDACLSIKELGPVHNIFTSSVASRPALVCLLTGSAAQQQSRLTPAERRRCILQQLERMYGSHATDIDIFSPDLYIERDWSQEQYSDGCFANTFRPGYLTKFGVELRSTNWDGCLHWASTETSYCYYGYMEGALAAGEHAAEAILKTI